MMYHVPTPNCIILKSSVNTCDLFAVDASNLNLSVKIIHGLLIIAGKIPVGLKTAYCVFIRFKEVVSRRVISAATGHGIFGFNPRLDSVIIFVQNIFAKSLELIS